jgi:CDP-diacylglycerol--glycerol-3-phosphate 3-phosphatidyltransferase/cardiolipin synthase
MTLATKITTARICLVPVFAAYAIAYGLSVSAGMAVEKYRWIALGIFIAAAISDGVDGWVARRFNQKSDLGAYLDPIADKFLVLTAIIILSIVDWAPGGWSLPVWFAALVVLRDCVILGGIRILYSAKKKVAILPHWSGKICTVSLFFTLAWVMLRLVPFSPVYPCIVSAVFVVWSMCEYIAQGRRILAGNA